ncbi:hypothetical protein Hanom_Chr07g00606691 [Helianthus anomalus]
MPESQSEKSEKHVATSKGREAEKVQSIEVPEVPEVQNVVITEVRVSTPPPPPESQHIPQEAESSKPKKTVLPDPFECFHNIRGELKDDILLDDEFDMFHDASVKDLKKKMSLLEKEKEKAEAEAERDELKKQLEELTKVNEDIKSVLKKHAKKIKKMEGDVDDNAKLFDLLSAEISDLHLKNVKLNEINKRLNQLISEFHEAPANEFKAIKLEMEALRADKTMKDEQHVIHYDGKSFGHQSTQRRKGLVIDTEETLRSSSQSVAGGSSSQADVEMVDAEMNEQQSFVLVGDSTPLSYYFEDIIRLVRVEQRKRKAKEPEMKYL